MGKAVAETLSSERGEWLASGRTVNAPEFDAVVVGCGPAGNTAAYRLAAAGRRVLLLDQAALPRHKVCGGGLSRKTLDELPFSVAPVIERRISGAFIAYRGRQPIFQREDGIGATMQRHVFDRFMTERAVAAGAVLRERCAFLRFDDRADEVVVHTQGGPVRSRVLIGADGVQSLVRRQLYPDRRVATVPAIEALVYPRPGMLELLGDRCIFDLGAIPAGYAWVFPKRDHFNVGLYRFRKRSDNLAMRQLLLDFIAGSKLLREAREVQVKALSIPIKPVTRELAKGNVVLVGDAAGVGEAFYGEGIYYATRSASLAANAILAFLDGRAPLAAYSRALGGLRRSLAYSRATARLFYLSPRLGHKYGVRNPTVSRLFAGVIAGTVTPAAALWRFLLLAPYWLTALRSPPVISPLFD